MRTVGKIFNVIGAVIVCTLAGMLTALALVRLALAAGAPYSDAAAIGDGAPVYALIIGAVWIWRRRSRRREAQ